MHVYHGVVAWGLFIEVLLLISIGGFGLGIHVLIAKHKKKRAEKRSLLKSTLQEMIANNKPFIVAQFPEELLGISSLIPVMLEIDKETTPDSWVNVKRAIEEDYLLPTARKLVTSPRWTNKLKAIRCFAYAPRVADENAIFLLLKHPIPVVRYAAAHAAAKLGTEAAFQAILEAMNASTRSLRYPLHDALKEGGSKVYRYLEKRLATETNQYTRVACIEMLTEKMNEYTVSLIVPDLQSTHKNLRVAAVRALGHYRSPETVKLLLPLLHHEDWEVRALAARSLGYQEATSSLEPLTQLLSDKAWWVRMNAALALKRMGARGVAKLQELTPMPDLYAYEIAQYVLALPDVQK